MNSSARIARACVIGRKERAWRQSVALLCLALLASVVGVVETVAAADSVYEILKHADSIKSERNVEFAALVRSLESRVDQMEPRDRDYWRYLHAWQRVYQGEYHAATDELRQIMVDAEQPVIQVRAQTTLVNVLALSRNYEPALSELGRLLPRVSEVDDVGAREQAAVVAAILYNKVGQYDLSLSYAEEVIKADWHGKGACRGGQLKLEALFRSESLALSTADLRAGIDACEHANERVHSSVIRAYLAQWLLKRGQFNEALGVLHDNYETVVGLATPRVLSEYDAILALAYKESGAKDKALQYAQQAVERAVKNEYTEPLVNGYRVLYALAKENGDARAALQYHERYLDADRGYLNDVTARQLAYQRVKHEVDALSKQNELLELQRKLSSEEIENSRLYILLLITVIGSVAVFAFKMRRSQQHFKELAQRDGLTGIFNRQHFIDRAEQMLSDAKRDRDTVCFVLCDLDLFKEINDAWGHPAGDNVLREAAGVFQAHVREADLVGRVGGEEFGILLVDCDMARARARCEEMRKAVETIELRDGDRTAKTSASFGIASSAVSGYEFRQLIVHADEALYDAKRRGRNCVAAYGELTEARAVATTSLVISQFRT